MNTNLYIDPLKRISELQQEFSATYPFLRLDFYLSQEERSAEAVPARKPVPTSSPLKTAGLTRDGYIDISGNMTVSTLEKLMRNKFGLFVQVSRKSDNIWLETSMTDDWTLQRQNEHGREITEGVDQEKNALSDYDLERGNN